MLRCRRLFRPVVLLSMAMLCSIIGYLIMLHSDTSQVRRIVDISGAQDLRDFQPREIGHSNLRVTNQEGFHENPDAEKLSKIAGLLGMEPGVNGEYKQIQNKILLIEEILEKFRTSGDEKQANGVLQEIQALLRKGNGQNEWEETHNSTKLAETSQMKITETPKKDINDVADLLGHIEDLLEQPMVPPPPIPNVKLDIKPYIKDPHYKPSTCPKAATKYAENSMWFKARYVPDIKVFMDKDDINNFTNFYKLSHYGLPFGVKSQDRKLLAKVVNNPNFTNPDVYDGNRPGCVRCAVVGCGGVLNGSNMGETIDAHDYVFRVNRALTKGRFAKDVGTRTSFYTFFPESQYAKEIENPSETKYFFTEFKAYDVEYAARLVQGLRPPGLHSKKRNSTWSVTSFYVLFKSYDMEYVLNMLSNSTPPIYTYDKGQKHWNPPKPQLNVHRLKIVHPDFMRYVFTRFLDSKAYRPTTGALVVFLAVHLCDEVNMYGFGYDSRFPMHYYDNKKVELTRAAVGSHDVDNERQLWKKLMDENILYLFNRTDV